MSPRRTLPAVLAAATLVATAGLAAAGPLAAHAEPGAGRPALSAEERTTIRDATRHYRDPAVAVAAGYLPTDECVPGMGFHYVDVDAIMDPATDPQHPEVLVYAPTRDGRRTLGAVEYLSIDPDQDVTTDEGRPFLFGKHGFDGPMEGHSPEMPVHFDKHVWLYKHNPDGLLTAVNPRVVC
jgi:hypothetical protein